MFELDHEKKNSKLGIARRAFFGVSASALGYWALRKYLTAETVEAVGKSGGKPKLVKIVEFTDAGVRQDVVEVQTIVKSDEEWRKQLSPTAFEVTRHADTERAFSGEYWNLHEPGLFRCICCDTALFSSKTKFESGTGWPSFWEPIAKENVHEISDFTFGMTRTAVACRRCDAHLGHVFDDGPRPTGLRYCMNSVSLRFIKAV
jgi:peptide-methionine (R)-S-oxide reductase